MNGGGNEFSKPIEGHASISKDVLIKSLLEKCNARDNTLNIQEIKELVEKGYQINKN